MRDLVIHAALAAAGTLLMLVFEARPGVAFWVELLAWLAREQAQVGMKYKLWRAGELRKLGPPPRPWRPWEWSWHTHREWLVPALVALGISLGWGAAGWN